MCTAPIAIISLVDWVVYILRCADDTLYTGITNDLAQRLQLHAAGKGAKYTRGRGPYEVRHTEYYTTKSEALKRERAIKRMGRLQKWALGEG